MCRGSDRAAVALDIRFAASAALLAVCDGADCVTFVPEGPAAIVEVFGGW